MALKKISEMTPEEMAAELGALREKRDAESATRQMAAKAAAKFAVKVWEEEGMPMLLGVCKANRFALVMNVPEGPALRVFNFKGGATKSAAVADVLLSELGVTGMACPLSETEAEETFKLSDVQKDRSIPASEIDGGEEQADADDSDAA
jgi:hypothetical protein